MKKRISIVFLLVYGICLITTMTGCVGYYPCTDRSTDNPEYLEDYATEYNFETYEIYSAWFGDIAYIGEYLEDDDVNVTPDQNHKMIVSHKDHLLSILYVTECTEDDIYYYEVMIPTFEEAYRLFSDYIIENNLEIELNTLESFQQLEFDDLLYYKTFDNYEGISPLIYRLTRYIHEDEEGNLTDRDIFMIITGEETYEFIEFYDIKDDDSMTRNEFTETLLAFTLSEITEELLEE